MANRGRDWLRQSERDLEVAKTTYDAKQFDWSCFASHQAAEKALKALYQRHNAEGWGHSLPKLVNELLEEEPDLRGHVDAARMLDKHYIPTRYPNGLPAGAPADAYTAEEAERAMDHAKGIIRYCASRCGAS